MRSQRTSRYCAAAHVSDSVAKPGLATLNDMVTGQAAFVGVIDQFKVMMIAMLIVSPLVLVSPEAAPGEPARRLSMATA